MNKIINKLETSNTPKKRLSNEDIYNDIYSLVSDQVDEMLQRGGTDEFNWRNATNYTSDILDNAPNNYWLISLVEDNKHEFEEFVCGMVDDGRITQDVADQMIANFSRYESIYWKNYKKMIKEAGLTRDEYLQRKWEIEE